MRQLFAIVILWSVGLAQANYETTAPDQTRVVRTTVPVPVKKHVPVPRALKPLIQHNIDQDDDESDDSIDLQVAYRRPDLVDNSELPLSDYVRLRLAHARRLALEEYRRIWG